MSTTTTTRPTHSKPAASKSGLSFSLALDQVSYLWTGKPGQMLTATLTLRCPDSEPLTLSFAGGQEFDIAIRDASGKQVGLWSAGQAFFDHVQTVSVAGERHWTATMALPEPPPGFPPRPGGAAVSAATYTATGYLTGLAGTMPNGVGSVFAQGGTGSMQPDEAALKAPILPIPFPPAAPAGVATPAYGATVSFTVHGLPVLLESGATSGA